MDQFKPENYSTVSPYLIVNDAAATIRFLESILGATVLRRFLDASNHILHAEVRIAESVVMLADAQPEWPSVPAHVHVYVADVDATYSRALNAGAESVQPPVQKDDADKRGGVKDAGGTTWWLATQQ